MPFSFEKRHFLCLTKIGGGGGGEKKLRMTESFYEQIIFIYRLSAGWVRYDRPAWFVRRLGFEQIREKDRITRWAFRFSNKNISLFGVVPEFTLAYTDKRSNVWQKEYRKMTLELSFVQNF